MKSAKRIAYEKKWVEEHREKVRANNKRWRDAHPEECKEQARRFKQTHPGWRAEYDHQWIKDNPEKVKTYHVKRKLKQYGLTIEQYDAMWQKQKGKCFICHRSENGRRLAVDHDHETGKVRHLLCARCNQTLGRVEENPSILKRMIDYLRE